MGGETSGASLGGDRRTLDGGPPDDDHGAAMSGISAKTQVCGILGHPVGHSLSPAIHNAAFEALSLDFVYVGHDVVPSGLAAAIDGIRALGYRGLSITIPHKIGALACVDEVDPTAAAIGCINTIVNNSGRLVGYNSDGRGALGALVRAGADPSGRRVVILGAGGAARAIAMTLAMESKPEKLVILGVVPEELAKLTSDVKDRCSAVVEGIPLNEEALAEALGEADLLLHTTPIGMAPKVGDTLVPRHLFRKGLVVFDAVYNPRRTRLIQEAAAEGCTTVEGLEMFLGQAIVQFELWTQKAAPVELMRRILDQKL